MPKLHEKHRPAEDRSDFVARMRECEQRAGSRRALALASGIPQSTIRGYTARQTEPPRDILVKLAKAAGVSVHWLTTGDGPIDLERTEAPQDVGISGTGEGIKEIAAAVAKKYSVPFDFALSRLMGSGEMRAIETAMQDWSRYSPIPIVGTDRQRIWGVLSQADLDKVSPDSVLKDIEVYQVQTNRMKPVFLKGDWALVDSSKKSGTGTYCVKPASRSDIEIRKITVTADRREISGAMDLEGLPTGFMGKGDQEMTFAIIGRVVGAIRFVTSEPSHKP